MVQLARPPESGVVEFAIAALVVKGLLPDTRRIPSQYFVLAASGEGIGGGKLLARGDHLIYAGGVGQNSLDGSGIVVVVIDCRLYRGG